MIDKQTGLPRQSLGLKPLFELDALTDAQRLEGIKNLIAHYQTVSFSAYSSNIHSLSNAGFRSFEVHSRVQQYWHIIKGAFSDGAQDTLLNDLYTALCCAHTNKALSFLGENELYNPVITHPLNQQILGRVLTNTDTTPHEALSYCTTNATMRMLLLRMMS